MSIRYPKAPNQVNYENRKLQAWLNRSEFQACMHINKHIREVVGYEDHGVYDKLTTNTHYEKDAENGRFLFEGVIIFEDKPLQSHLNADNDGQDAKQKVYIDLGFYLNLRQVTICISHRPTQTKHRRARAWG